MKGMIFHTGRGDVKTYEKTLSGCTAALNIHPSLNQKTGI